MKIINNWVSPTIFLILGLGLGIECWDMIALLILFLTHGVLNLKEGLNNE